MNDIVVNGSKLEPMDAASVAMKLEVRLDQESTKESARDWQNGYEDEGKVYINDRVRRYRCRSASIF